MLEEVNIVCGKWLNINSIMGNSVSAGTLILIPMVFNPIINLINDLYGIYNWRKLEKTQSIK